MKAFKIIIAILVPFMVGAFIAIFTYNFFSERVVYEYECDSSSPDVRMVTIKSSRFGALAYAALWHKDATLEIKVYTKDGKIIEYNGDLQFEGYAAVNIVGTVVKNDKEVHFFFETADYPFPLYGIREGSSEDIVQQKRVMSGRCKVKSSWHARPNTKY